MAITQGQITLDEAVTIDKRLQTVTRTSTDTVHNEVFCLIDPDAASGDAAMVRIINTAPSTEYGMVVRNIPSGVQPVSDNAGSLTVDNAALSVVGGGTEATALRVTVATDSTGVLSVDDNGASLTVDGTVSVSGTVTVDNGGTFAVQDSQALTDNGAFVDGTSKLFMAGYIFDEVAGAALTENDAAAARVTANRAVVSAIEDGATRARYATVTAANALKVDGSAVTQPVSGTVTANAGTGLGSLAVVGSGTEATALRVTVATDSTGVLSIDDNGASLTVDGTVGVSGTVAVTQSTTPWTMHGQTAHDSPITDSPVRVGGRASAAAQADVSADGDAVNAWFLRNGAQATVITAAGALIGGDATNGLDVDVTRVTGTVSVSVAAETANKIEVQGDVADDIAAAGNPVQIGVIARNVDRTAVANADISYALGDLLGKQVVLPYAVPELFVSGLATLTGTGDTSVIGAGGAGVRNYITSLSASNTSATATRVDFKDGTTIQVSFYVAASGGGAAQSFPVPLRGTANTAFQAALSAGVTDVRVSAQGYKAAN